MFCHLHCRFQSLHRTNSAKAALSVVRMDREVLAGVVRQCALHNGRTTDGDKPWMEQGGAVLRHFVVYAVPPFKGNSLPTSCPSAPPNRAFVDACACVVGRSHFMAMPHRTGALTKHIILCLVIVLCSFRCFFCITSFANFSLCFL